MAEMKAVIAPDGGTTIHTIDLLEDLWFDYLTYRQQAEIAAKRKDVLKIKQYLRGALFAFMPYITGVANRWCAQAWKKAALPDPGLASFLCDKSLPDKCEFLATQAGAENIPADALAVVSLLARDLANLRPGKELEVFESLSLTELQQAEDSILQWYDATGQKLGFPRHENTQKTGRDFAQPLGTIIEESNQRFAELRNDPEAWKQELEERQGWE